MKQVLLDWKKQMYILFCTFTVIFSQLNSLKFQMEALVREMQDPETGIPIRSQKLFLTSIPSAFMGE